MNGSAVWFRLRFQCWYDRGTDTLRMRCDLGASPGERHGRSEAQFLEHLILRAELIWNFQPSLPPFRPWWKLWSKEPVPELPAIVGDLRNAA